MGLGTNYMIPYITSNNADGPIYKIFDKIIFLDKKFASLKSQPCLYPCFVNKKIILNAIFIFVAEMLRYLSTRIICN